MYVALCPFSSPLISPPPALTFLDEMQMWPFVLAALGETAGYAFRRVSAARPKGRSGGLVWYLGQRRVSFTAW